MPAHKFIIMHNGEKYDYDRICKTTGFQIDWAYKQIKELRKGNIAFKDIISQRKTQNNSCFIGNNGEEHTVISLMERCPGLRRKEATQRLRDVNKGMITEDELTSPADSNTDKDCLCYDGVYEELTPEQDQTLKDWEKQINSSIDKMDKYYKPLF